MHESGMFTALHESAYESDVNALRRQIENAITSEKVIPARDVFDRLERKYVSIAAEWEPSATP